MSVLLSLWDCGISPVGDISGVWIKQKKMCSEVATCSASKDLIIF